jgi:hypothetical protein
VELQVQIQLTEPFHPRIPDLAQALPAVSGKTLRLCVAAFGPDWHSENRCRRKTKRRECARDFQECQQVIIRVIQTDGQRVIVKLKRDVAGLC